MLDTHDPDLVDRFVADEYRNHNAFVDDGQEANRQFWAAFFAALPDVRVIMEDLVIPQDRVVGRFVYLGTHTGDLWGIPASGKPVEMRSIDIWRVKDGLFVEHWDELNLLEMFQQMGAIPPLGDGPADGAVMHLAAHLAAFIAVMSTGVVYGTDAFCALVQRPALARVDDATLTAVMGNVHRFADRRLPAPGLLGVLAPGAASVVAALAGRPGASVTAGAALALLLVWLLLYLRISAPINRTLTAAADKHATPGNARDLQRDWDRIIDARATLQGLAVAALCVSLLT
jgi:predicted SnoaL-like aldol condensation-catalyzing enzyme